MNEGSSPKTKYNDCRGLFAAFASDQCVSRAPSECLLTQCDNRLDLTFKAAAQAWETYADPKMKFSNEPADAPFSRAFPEDKTLWRLLERDSYCRNRFDLTMQAAAALQPPDAILKGVHATMLGACLMSDNDTDMLSSVRLAKSSSQFNCR